MSGLYTNGMPEINLAPVSGAGIPVDTGNAAGENPETAYFGLLRLATILKMFANSVDLTTVAGSRYYVRYTISVSTLITGVQVLIGGTGGTDKLIAEIHDSAGNLVATSNTAGATVATANTVQQLAMYDNTNGVALPYLAAAGTYYIAIQSNGSTDKLAAYDMPGLTVPVGSATGVFGTGAAITPPTTYTAGVGPVATPY